ncbi:hypothetical protein PEP31012_01351 [Pandoraea eparura]|uniref:Uncharacterized protein n=1 Tax=Pandoraea eparura TaxID=2508291 RepID=A0A5E4THD3_9BURK|nr:hypothetical protein PEP31012_01351 [Pandoraea eparura]
MVTLDPKVGADETLDTGGIRCQLGRPVHRRVRLWCSLIRTVDSLARASGLYSRGSQTASARPGIGNGSVHDGNAFRCQVCLAHTMPRRYTRLATPRWGLNRRLSPPVFISAARATPPRRRSRTPPQSHLPSPPPQPQPPPPQPQPPRHHADGLGESADFARGSALQLSNHKTNTRRARNFGKSTECLWIPVRHRHCMACRARASLFGPRGEPWATPAFPAVFVPTPPTLTLRWRTIRRV